jgi:hypothetical protein
MSHLDEGTLHALLDGELDLAEVSEIQRHLGTCVACGVRLQEVKQFLAEADHLVVALELPAAARPAALAAEAPSARTRRDSPPASTPRYEPDPWESPVILLPDQNDPLASRKRWFKVFRWAAMIAVIVGGGRLLLSAINPGPSLPRDPEISSTSARREPAVASPQETNQREPLVIAQQNKAARPAVAQKQAPTQRAAPPPAAVARAEVTDSAPDAAESLASALADTGPSIDTAESEGFGLAAADVADSAATDTVRTDSSAAPSAGAVASRSDQSRRESDEAATRRAAAAALEELDLQRRRERAAAATAALPPARPAQPAAEAPPAPRTPEQRAQVYMRIGLDEAARQLGRPLHVIEGMTPQLIGLVQGRLVPGADVNRPVVRVVYLDTRGRMILLDQQRLLPGQAAASVGGNLRWTVGEVMLYLRGEPSPDVLRSLQRRVR